MKKMYIVIACDLRASYDFNNDKGERVQGVANYCCIQEVNGNDSKKPYICKQAGTLTSGTAYSELYYDRFGRVVGGVCD